MPGFAESYLGQLRAVVGSRMLLVPASGDCPAAMPRLGKTLRRSQGVRCWTVPDNLSESGLLIRIVIPAKAGIPLNSGRGIWG
jgi:hypothetical protein